MPSHYGGAGAGWRVWGRESITGRGHKCKSGSHGTGNNLAELTLVKNTLETRHVAIMNPRMLADLHFQKSKLTGSMWSDVNTKKIIITIISLKS